MYIHIRGRRKHVHKKGVNVSRQCSPRKHDTPEGLQEGLHDWSREQGERSKKRLPSLIQAKP